MNILFFNDLQAFLAYQNILFSVFHRIFTSQNYRKSVE